MKAVGRPRWHIGLRPLYIILSSSLLIIFLLSYTLIQYSYTQRRIAAYITEADGASLLQLSNRLETEIQETMQYMKSLQENTELKKLMGLVYEGHLSAFELNQRIQNVNACLIRMQSAFSEIDTISIVTPDMMYGSESNIVSRERSYYEELQCLPVQRALKRNSMQIAFLPQSYPSDSSGHGTRFAGRLLTDFGSGEAYMVFRMQDKWLEKLLSIDKAESFLYYRDGTEDFFYPEVSEEMRAAASARTGEGNGSFFETIDGEHYNLSYRALNSTEFMIVSVQNTTGLFNPLKTMRFYAAIAVLLSILFSGGFFVIYTRRKVADLQRLCQSAKDYVQNGLGNLLPLKYKTQSLHEDTTLSYFFIVALPLVVFQLTFFLFSSHILDHSSRELFSFSLNRKVEGFEALITRNSRISGNIMFDRIVQSVLKEVNDREDWNHKELTETIAHYIFQPSIQSLDLYDVSGNLFYSSRLDYNNVGENINESVKKSYGEVIFLGEDVQNSGQMKFIRKIRNVYQTGKNGMPTIGYLTCIYTDRSLSSILGESSRAENNLYIIDRAGNIVYSQTDDASLGLQLKNENFKTENTPVEFIGENGRKYLAFFQPFSNAEWKAIAAVPAETFRKDSTLLLSFNINILSLFCVLIFFVSRILANFIVNPVRRLIENIMEIDSCPETGAGYIRYYPHEFNELTYAFNKMTEQVKHIYDLESERNQAELNALLAQINPHFMYNTFESIRWMNKTGDKESVDKMIGYLSDLFRLGISADKNWLPFSEEVQYAEAYLSIQKMRYDRQLNYSWEIAPETEDVVVPKLILQPLIENSIYHGIRKLETDNGIIAVRSMIENDRLVIDVIDNGPGFTEEERQRQEQLVLHPEKHGKNGIGLSNVYRRLNYCYGGNVSIEIRSIPYVETIVRIAFPAISPNDGLTDF